MISSERGDHKNGSEPTCAWYYMARRGSAKGERASRVNLLGPLEVCELVFDLSPSSLHCSIMRFDWLECEWRETRQPPQMCGLAMETDAVPHLAKRKCSADHIALSV